MARGAGSTFDTILPLAKKYRVAAINWGRVRARPVCPEIPRSSPYVLIAPAAWFHDIFHEDGTPYR